MENYSIWEDKNQKTLFNDKLEKECDVLIIGGGITGITTSYFLKDSNLNVVLIDKSNLRSGITAKTTAKLNYLQGTIYQDLEKHFNIDISKKYFNSQIDAINLINKIIKYEKINCDLKKVDSYIFTKEKKNIDKIDNEKKLLDSFNVNSKIIKDLPILFPIEYGLVVNDTYTFHPIKYLNKLIDIIKNNIKIHENVMALEIEDKKDYFITKTNKGNIKSKYVIVSCFYPFFIIPGLIPLKTYIKREYVNFSKFKYNYDFTAISIDNVLHSIRFYKDYIIYGSNMQRLTNKIVYKNSYEKSISDFKRYFSHNPDLTWMNQDIMSNDYLPLIGEVSNNLLISTAYNSWGMTNGTIAAKILSDIILKNKNEYINLFKPNRINKNNIINSIIGSMYYSKVYIQTAFKKNPVFYNDYVYIIKIKNKYYGVYCDKDEKKHVVNLKCPHMKCNLVFNDYEKTWDCPCHGSRFDVDGNVILGPANYSISTDFKI